MACEGRGGAYNIRMSMRLITGGLIFLIIVGAIGAWWWFSPVQEIARSVAVCLDAAPNMKAVCYTDKIGAMLAAHGLQPALALVAASYNADPAVATFCHSNMHLLGASAYKQFAARGSIDLTPDASFCGFGFYHGFMEEMLVETGSLDQAKAFCAYVAKKLGGDQQYAEGSCYHGIGHGVTDGTNAVDRSDAASIAAPGLALCRKIAIGTLEMRCASGVFNSVALMYFDPAYNLDAHNDPYALCRTNSFDASEKEACYDQMNTLVSRLSKHQPSAMIDYASTVNDPHYRAIALKGALLLTYAQPTRNQLADGPSVCEALRGTDRDACIAGLVDSVIEFGPPGTELERGLSFCEQAAWKEDDARLCTNELMRYAQGLFTPSDQEALCYKIPPSLLPSACTKPTS